MLKMTEMHWKSKWPASIVEAKVADMKIAAKEGWSDLVVNAIISRRGSQLSALQLAFAAGRHAECSFMEWLDREAISAYVHLDPVAITQEDDKE